MSVLEDFAKAIEIGDSTQIESLLATFQSKSMLFCPASSIHRRSC
jgi:hypothetical protein